MCLCVSADPQCLLTNGKLPLWAKRLVSLLEEWESTGRLSGWQRRSPPPVPLPEVLFSFCLLSVSAEAALVHEAVCLLSWPLGGGGGGWGGDDDREPSGQSDLPGLYLWGGERNSD